MSMQDQITEEWKQAMKARSAEKDTLALIRTELKNEAIRSRPDGSSATEVDDDAALKVLQKMAKQRREAIGEYEKGNRDDLAAKEREELDVISRFLPAGLTEQELEAMADEIISQTGAAAPSDMGKVMGPLMKKVAGRADGKAVKSVVQAKLSPS